MTITDPTTEPHTGDIDAVLCWLNLADMASHPDNPRHAVGDLAELTRSIRSHGIIEPLVVLPANDDGVYLIVAGRRNVGEEIAALIEGLGFEVVSVTEASARRISEAYARWGKGVHPAGLNYGDCFAYEVASERGCPLLFVGDDFLRTDLRSVL